MGKCNSCYYLNNIDLSGSFMKYAFLVLLLAFSPITHAQPSKSKTGSTTAKKQVAKPKQTVATAKPKPKQSVTAAKPKPKATPPLTEKEQFEKASAYELASERVPALEKFLTSFPQSESRAAALDLLASSRVLIAEEKLLSGDADGAVALLKRVVAEAPVPVPDELFESISRIPTDSFLTRSAPGGTRTSYYDRKQGRGKCAAASRDGKLLSRDGERIGSDARRCESSGEGSVVRRRPSHVGSRPSHQLRSRPFGRRVREGSRA
jgi:hypothetical protein